MFGQNLALSLWDPFDLNWNIWRQFETMDRQLDRTFSKFEKEMEDTRQSMLQQLPEFKQKKEIKPSSTSYSKTYCSVDEREDIINGKRINYKTLETTREKDGVKIPHKVRSIECDPPCELETLQKCIQSQEQFKEDVGGKNEAILSTFLNDVKKQNLDAGKIVKYQNEVKFNPDTNKQDYQINVSFLDKNNKKHVYQWCKKQDAIEGEAKIDEPQMLQSSQQQQQYQQQQQFQTQEKKELSKEQQEKLGQQFKQSNFQNLPQQMQI